MKYKEGDKVRIKSLDWYNKNKDKFGEVRDNEYIFVKSMTPYCDNILTIEDKTESCYLVKENTFWWTDEMIEELVQDENNHLTETVVDYVKESNDRYRIVIDPRFDIEVDEGEYYAVRRKKEYPKTYEECEKVLRYDSHRLDNMGVTVRGYKWELIRAFQILLICRDAYWKIAGEEMGLSKPWEPDYNGTFEDGAPIKYVIYSTGTHILKGMKSCPNHILAFPTEEMRDAFYENFKSEIEICKELL